MDLIYLMQFRQNNESMLREYVFVICTVFFKHNSKPTPVAFPNMDTFHIWYTENLDRIDRCVTQSLPVYSYCNPFDSLPDEKIL